MKYLKRTVILIMILATLFSLAACQSESKETASAKRVGVLMAPGAQEKIAHRKAEHAVEVNYTYYENLTSALMGLQRGDIDVFGSEGAAAEYIVLRHENLMTGSPSDRLQIDHAMMTMNDKKEVFDILDGAIRDMKADGTMDKLIENDLRAFIETDAKPKELPHFEGAETITVGVTGDVPPMDFVSSSGAPAGFNIALLSEIANRAQVNFELVQTESGARPLALSSGKVDAIFWTRNVTCVDCDVTWNEAIDNTLVTESYITQPAIDIMLKK